MKNLYIVYHYSINQLDTKIAFAFDSNHFPVKIDSSSDTFTSKSELIESLLSDEKIKGYKSLKLLSNEAFNSAIGTYQSKNETLNLFDDHGETIPTTDQSSGSFFGRLFGSQK